MKVQAFAALAILSATCLGITQGWDTRRPAPLSPEKLKDAAVAATEMMKTSRRLPPGSYAAIDSYQVRGMAGGEARVDVVSKPEGRLVTVSFLCHEEAEGPRGRHLHCHNLTELGR